MLCILCQIKFPFLSYPILSYPILSSAAERVEALALLGIPQRAVGRGFDPRQRPAQSMGSFHHQGRNPTVSHQKSVDSTMPTVERLSIRPGFSQYSFLANPCKINPVLLLLLLLSLPADDDAMPAVGGQGVACDDLRATPPAEADDHLQTTSAHADPEVVVALRVDLRHAVGSRRGHGEVSFFL